jgi:hypothetical protein
LLAAGGFGKGAGRFLGLGGNLDLAGTAAPSVFSRVLGHLGIAGLHRDREGHHYYRKDDSFHIIDSNCCLLLIQVKLFKISDRLARVAFN